MAMKPHERSLVNKLKDKPFALLGVNLDNTKEQCKKVEQEKNINWRSWFDGRGGAIAKKYNIQFLPTIYVLDHKGVIRYKGVREQAMDDAVDTLLKEMASSNKSGD